MQFGDRRSRHLEQGPDGHGLPNPARRGIPTHLAETTHPGRVGWQRDDIPDVITERVKPMAGVHPKPVHLQARLIRAVTEPNDVVLDPAAGSYSVMTAAHQVGRQFLGCDIDSAP